MATTEQSKQASSAEAQATLAKIQQYPPLFDLGKIKAKKAKKLKKGKLGPLEDEVSLKHHQVFAGLEADNHPIIFSYEQKPSKKPKLKNKVDLLGVKVNRKKWKKQLKKSGISSSFL
ncbi:hypothetical protein HDF24_02630 [Mucilaginibacter sp. X4EP1]|jgi:hypothetical protein|uniref:hypothetical protein n=1 Tax=Mucilaginibacter sp. X4EP1 TaxID=2723092 RepID=UPI002166C1CF|nr:hypothetical protein [Mucilaginibacter sp. X4EP1]MCS3811915.1 hypothetical protein [Mucilaginibacter sp. X4EP1]